MAERNHGEWRELRARTDSLATAVFLIAGGTLTLSITVLVNSRSSIDPGLQSDVKWSWFMLLASIVSFILLKVSIIVQSFMRGIMHADRFNRIVAATNYVGWGIGLVGLVLFVAGVWKMIFVGLGVVFA